jgi:hypothetical protein
MADLLFRLIIPNVIPIVVAALLEEAAPVGADHINNTLDNQRLFMLRGRVHVCSNI